MSTLQILKQSPWSSKGHRSTLTINVAAYNGGEVRLTDLRMEVAFGPHIESRGDYSAVLAYGPETTISSVTEPVRGAVEPGDSRTIGITIDLAEVPGIDQEDSQTYPAVVQLLTGDTVLASLVTPVIYLVRAPEAPLRSSMWVQLPAPIAFGADGALVDTSFPDAIGPGGSLREALDAISDATVGRHPHGPLDLVIDPLLVTQARDSKTATERSTGRRSGRLALGTPGRAPICGSCRTWSRRRARSRPSRIRMRTHSCPRCCTEGSSRHRSPPSGSAGPASSRPWGRRRSPPWRNPPAGN